MTFDPALWCLEHDQYDCCGHYLDPTEEPRPVAPVSDDQHAGANNEGDRR